MRFINDDTVPGMAIDACERAHKLWQRTDHARLNLEAAKAFLIGQHKVLIEVLAQFLLPLRQQGLRRQHKRRADKPAQGQFFVNKPRLDRFAEANIVGEDRAWPFLAQDLFHHTKLVCMRPHTVIEYRWRERSVERRRYPQSVRP